MGRATDAGIRAWQEAAGIVPAHGRRAELLNEMLWEAARIVRQPPPPRPSLDQAVALIRIITLESSGIRDGDGSWYGCDPLRDTIDLLADPALDALMAEINTLDAEERPA